LIRVPGAAAGRIEPDNIALFAAIINILIECADSGGEMKKNMPRSVTKGKKDYLLYGDINNTSNR